MVLQDDESALLEDSDIRVKLKFSYVVVDNVLPLHSAASSNLNF